MGIDTSTANVVVGDEHADGALLQLALLIALPSQRVSGHGEITNVAEAPNDDISISELTGRIRALRWGDGVRVVTLSGSWLRRFPPPAIGEIKENFSSTLLIAPDDWNGIGSFSYGNTNVDDVRVQPAIHPGVTPAAG